jgi:hypothetical protein
MTRKKLIQYMKKIAREYKVRIAFRSGFDGGFYETGKIVIGDCQTKNELIDTFCHELGHFLNDCEGKYELYHRYDSDYGIRKMGIRRYANYALKAEIYTEKRGRELAKKWFPNHKFTQGYRNNEFWRGFFFGYFHP